MGINPRSFIRSTCLLLPVIVLVLWVSIAKGQTVSTGAAQEQEEVATVMNPSASNAAVTKTPVFTDYRGIRIGMTAKEVRSKLDDELKKGDKQDFLVFSESESAQIYYDDKGKVTAISIDYFGDNSAPTPDAVLGAPLQAKADGSMYQLNRYSEAGYWVSYNRTAGDKPIVTITMQKM